ncbi:hypothetical protein [Pseudonocardia sp. ICBG1034]|uniref:hypothetical protein n=1 Tax=Pseudonocardia sp. ICBG1034 TaxID=2844381 RepID=UPI001CCA4E9A|nr:hypothetical protein [Pseudonocardia sp. ICBG1034]
MRTPSSTGRAASETATNATGPQPSSANTGGSAASTTAANASSRSAGPRTTTCAAVPIRAWPALQARDLGRAGTDGVSPGGNGADPL